ncbi:hypothetical protein M758_1G183800 [Ceratodon purpureus]|uniref:VOC domain-containing protein n=1 Tax=Ceratodon purpureus TaxID=3225 RepID=A0A8T0J8T5_CERPU|nr:hypothetical protein KC19_1G187300 [Ceratodon purpureus]KAG0630515.1 hypothetical protein M758_1G183800 [Ceratodon purpureus]
MATPAKHWQEVYPLATAAENWQREGNSTVSTLIVADGSGKKVVEFMTEVLNAETLAELLSEDKKTVLHASMKIGDTVVMVKDGTEEVRAFPSWLHLYVEDVDKTYELAMGKGLESVVAPKDEFFGDRMGAVKDSAGNTWWIATHKFNPQCAGGKKAEHWQREGHSTVSSWIVADGALKVVEFATEVLNAHTMVYMLSEDKKTVLHATLKIGDTVVMIQDGNKEAKAFPSWLRVYVEDVDKTYELAVSKGLESVQEPKDEFYGDREGGVKDSAGNTWWFASQKFKAPCPFK